MQYLYKLEVAFTFTSESVNFTNKNNKKTLDFYIKMSYNDIRMTAEKHKVADTPG